ncbi:7451_t:CDS:2, partial [Diversispora eburnea]
MVNQNLPLCKISRESENGSGDTGLASLFATQQNQPTFSIPDVSEILIKKREKEKGVENEDNNNKIIREEVNKIMKSIEICEKKECESSLIFDKVRKLLSNQNLDILNNCLDNTQTMARDMVNNWRVKDE